MKMQVPEKVNFIINTLIEHGFEAYAVGGCVRDTILNRDPGDWDITTSANPEEVKKLFRRTIDTGIEHGTVTVMMNKEGFEVTTYRIDGEYEDNRHPKNVEFTTNLVEDLKRRDFTINAMAYNDRNGLVDVFGGLDDLKEKVIKCVGNPEDRFDEDALRILRAVRFSAQLGFRIEENTTKAIAKKAEKLKNISAERIRVELNKLLLSDEPSKLFIAYETGITKIIFPEFDAMLNTNQNNPHHCYNVGIHALKAVEEVGKDHILRWTMLLHDIAKPLVRTTSTDGIDHFYGHVEKSASLAKLILRRLKFDNDTTNKVVRLIRYHDYQFHLTSTDMRHAIYTIGEDIMEYLFEVKKADILAQNPKTHQDKLTHLEEAQKIYHRIKANKDCVNLKSLAINGSDLLQLGFKPGKIMGDVLNQLLKRVLEEPSMNNREQLLELAKQMYR